MGCSSDTRVVPDYAELHCLSNFSFLRGASHPEELVERADALGYRALALTDEVSLAGIVRAHAAARGRALRLIVGSELQLDNGIALVALATNRRGYARLSRLITRSRRQAPKGGYRVDDPGDALDECLVLWSPERSHDHEPLAYLRSRFAGRLWMAVARTGQADDCVHLERLAALSRRTGVPMVATGNVLMHTRARRFLQDTLTAIRTRTPLAEAGHALQPNGERHLRPRSVLARRYPRELLKETLAVAERCTFSLDELRYEYPDDVVPEGHSPASRLRQLTEEGLVRRWPTGAQAAVRRLIERELALIEELGYARYFLTVHDLVAFAHSRDIYCQGRGSAANSAVCYALGITEVDPGRMQLLIERFISRERDEPPDIDVDFEHHRREEVLQYLYRRYGRERAGMTATVIRYRTRSAIRDVGKAPGLSEDRLSRLAALSCWSRCRGTIPAQRLQQVGIDPDTPIARRLRFLVAELYGFPRHLSQHTGGMVISHGPLSELVPIENAAMPGRTVIQWSKDDLDTLGLLKVDCLSLGTLSAIHQAIDLIRVHYGRELTLTTIPPEDPEVYAMIRRADTVGVFQIESRARMTLLPRLGPRNYYDPVVQVAIVRPGPIQGGMVHPYLRRRRGEAPVIHPHPTLRPILERTPGVAVYQEQIMQLAVVAAGFTGGEADRLRRALASVRGEAAIEALRKRFVGGMRERGYPEPAIEQVWQQVEGFAGYGFPESHAASFALLAYASAWLMHHYPATYTAALIDSQPMGFYAPAQLVANARRHGVEVRPVTVTDSDWNCTLEPTSGGSPALRPGLRLVKHLSRAGVERLLAARKDKPFESIRDLVGRTGPGQRDLEALAAAEALQTLSGNRRLARWRIMGIETPTALTLGEPQEAIPLIPRAGLGEEIVADHRATGLSLRPLPLTLLRSRMDRRSIVTLADLRRLPHGPAHTAGIVLVRQRPPSARGVVFRTLEDETDSLNVIAPRRLVERAEPAVATASLIEIHGRLERDGEVVQVLARRLIDRSDWLGELTLPSRDFC